MPTGRANMTTASCCALCAATPSCVGWVLTTRKGQPGLTCYPKTLLTRCNSGGHCTTGGQLHPPKPAKVGTLELHPGRCLTATVSGNVVLADCDPSSRQQLFNFSVSRNRAPRGVLNGAADNVLIRDLATGRCLDFDKRSGGNQAAANVVVSSRRVRG